MYLFVLVYIRGESKRQHPGRRARSSALRLGRAGFPHRSGGYPGGRLPGQPVAGTDKPEPGRGKRRAYACCESRLEQGKAGSSWRRDGRLPRLVLAAVPSSPAGSCANRFGTDTIDSPDNRRDIAAVPSGNVVSCGP